MPQVKAERAAPYLSPCGRGYEGRVNVSEPLAEVGEGFKHFSQNFQLLSIKNNPLTSIFHGLPICARIISSRIGYPTRRRGEAGPVPGAGGRRISLHQASARGANLWGRRWRHLLSPRTRVVTRTCPSSGPQGRKTGAEWRVRGWRHRNGARKRALKAVARQPILTWHGFVPRPISHAKAEGSGDVHGQTTGRNRRRERGGVFACLMW